MDNNHGEFILYQTEDGQTRIDVRMENDTVWLSLDQMAILFGRDKSTISRHIKNIFEEKELDRNSVVANFATTATDGKTYLVDHYSLDVIISVGYRVKSLRGTQFRIWANSVLREFCRCQQDFEQIKKPPTPRQRDGRPQNYRGRPQIARAMLLYHLPLVFATIF